MIEAKWVGKIDVEKVKRKIDDSTFNSFNHAASTLRLIAKRSIRQSKKPALPGQIVHTQTKALPKAIIYYVDKRKRIAVIGAAYNLIGLTGKAHELGGSFRGRNYPSRPYMKPAMEKVIPRLPSMWAASYK